MDTVIEGLLGAIKLGEAERRGSITLLPIFADLPPGPAYLTLGQAVEAGTLTVTEVSEGGSVPELVARNLGKDPVLILDGEELQGAKQNRVLNTTVLIAAGTKVVIPVSCVEHGRWHHISDRFSNSGHHSAYNIRVATHASVTGSLRATGRYRSDQSRVWQEVANLSQDAGVASPTGAMFDVYEERKSRIDDFAKALPLAEGQNGIAAVHDGRVIGMDILSRPEAYAQVHDKLVRSYVFESWHETESDISADEKAAKTFVVELGDLVPSSHESPGAGLSYRYTGPGIVGSALVFEDALLHAAFFGVES